MDKTHYVYVVENNIGEFYYGKRSCRGDYSTDTYMGSGTLLRAKIKSGKYLWVKRILCVCHSEDEAYRIEMEVIGDLWRNNEKCLNLTKGGRGGVKAHPLNGYLSHNDELTWMYNHKLNMKVKAPYSFTGDPFLVEQGWTTKFKWGCKTRSIKALLDSVSLNNTESLKSHRDTHEASACDREVL